MFHVNPKASAVDAASCLPQPTSFLFFVLFVRSFCATSCFSVSHVTPFAFYFTHHLPLAPFFNPLLPFVWFVFFLNRKKLITTCKRLRSWMKWRRSIVLVESICIPFLFFSFLIFEPKPN